MFTVINVLRSNLCDYKFQEKEKEMKKFIRILTNIIRCIIIIICVITLCFSSYMIFTNIQQMNKQNADDEQLIAEIMQQQKEDSNEETTEQEEKPVEIFEPDKNTYSQLVSGNSEYVGWIKWDTNIINEPIMHNRKDDYYLKHNYYGNESTAGSICLDDAATVDDQNIFIYGHSMFYFADNLNGKFTPLRNMVNQSYYETNKTFKIWWADRMTCYEVVAACDIDATTTNWGYATPVFYSEEGFNKWKSLLQEVNLISSSTEYAWTDKFVTLQTCTNPEGNQRTFVVAKAVGDYLYSDFVE